MSSNLLARIPFFTGLPDSELDRLAAQMDVVNLKAGELLFCEGDAGELMYVVIKGELVVLKGPGTEDELILNTIHPGEYIGEMSLITGSPRTASIRACDDDVVLLSMNRKQLDELLQRHPKLASTMVTVLAYRLDNTNIATFRDLTEKNHQLQKAYDELKAMQEQLIEKERLERELKVAADIQMSILPDILPSPDGFDFGGRILPARQVGGDFYDVFELGENKYGVLIGDVADKGVPSAIFMARAHALIIAEADDVTSPSDVLRMVNGHVTRFEKSTQFVTVLFGILDTSTGEFSYARGGHEPPLLLTPDGQVQRLPHQAGMALGLWENIVLDENSLTLPKGSLLVMFTDGMTDCRDPKGEPFGLERVRNAIGNLKNINAQASCDELFDKLMKYQDGSKQDDDVTLVAIHAK